MKEARRDRRGWYHSIGQQGHKCYQNVLLISKKIGSATDQLRQWRKIRERNKHHFRGTYSLCHQFTAEQQKPCAAGETGCWYAHNEEERILWNNDKEGSFSIVDFVQQNKTDESTNNEKAALERFVKEHPGHLEFTKKGELVHIWQELNEIDKKRKTKNIALCIDQKFCLNRNKECRKAHSEVERDFWKLEQQTEKSRKYLVEQLNAILSDDSLHDDNQQDTEELCQEIYTYNSDDRCPFRLKFICGLCWKDGKQIPSNKEGTSCSVSQGEHDWLSQRIVISVKAEQTVVIRSLPNIARKSPDLFQSIGCYHMETNGICTYVGPQDNTECQFSHSDVEGKVWEWQARNRGKVKNIHLILYIIITSISM